MRLIVISLCLLLGGCAADSPYYLEAGLGARINELTDPLLRTGTDNNAHNPTFEIAWGRHFKSGKSRCELYHWSHLLDGGPFNEHAEQYELRARCIGTIFGNRTGE